MVDKQEYCIPYAPVSDRRNECCDITNKIRKRWGQNRKGDLMYSTAQYLPEDVVMKDKIGWECEHEASPTISWDAYFGSSGSTDQ